MRQETIQLLLSQVSSYSKSTGYSNHIGGFFKPKAARLGMREDAQAKILPPRYKTEVAADSGGSAVVQVLGQG